MFYIYIEITVYDFLKDKRVNTKFSQFDYLTKSDLMTTKLELVARIEKGNKEIVIWVIAFLTGIIGIAVAIIKLF